MSSMVETFSSCNITLVYNVLPLETVDRNEPRTIIGTGDALSMDTPELLVLVSPSSRIHFELGDRRVRVTDQANSPLDTPLPSMVSRIHRLVVGPRLQAYGYNYDGSMVCNDERGAREVLKRPSIPNEAALSQVVEGEIVASIPHYVFDRKDARYDFALQASPDDSRIVAHLNAHFELRTLSGEAALPAEEALSSSFAAESEWFSTLVRRLLEVDADERLEPSN